MPAPDLELYQAVIDGHRRRPRNRGPLPQAQRSVGLENPACGDQCTVHFLFDDPDRGPLARLLAVHFTGAGCALSQASASLLTVALTGCTTAAAELLITQVETMVRTGQLPPNAKLGDLGALAAAHAFPARHACALLAWQAARTALASAAAERP